jgi:hypothetical protein
LFAALTWKLCHDLQGEDQHEHEQQDIRDRYRRAPSEGDLGSEVASD